jgi:hypothetical protein
MSGAYTGQPFGPVQTKVFDQMTTALPGDPMSALDLINQENISCQEPNGIGFGLGVKRSALANIAEVDSSVQDNQGDTQTGITTGAETKFRQGLNNFGIHLPSGGEAETDLAGIVMRSTAGQVDASGNPIVAFDRMAAVARPNRAGLKLWVKDNIGNVNEEDSVYWIISNQTGHSYPIGSFINAAITTSQFTDTVLITDGKFISKSDTSGVVGVEIKTKN